MVATTVLDTSEITLTVLTPKFVTKTSPIPLSYATPMPYGPLAPTGMVATAVLVTSEITLAVPTRLVTKTSPIPLSYATPLGLFTGIVATTVGLAVLALAIGTNEKERKIRERTLMAKIALDPIDLLLARVAKPILFENFLLNRCDNGCHPLVKST